jgi:carbonic anhydrase
MHPLHHLLANNRAWSEKIRRNRPDFFSTLSRQQAPKYLWIGCADSRVPANEICGLLPGELFVHRNVANLVNQTDINCLSVMHYAIDVLKVEHIIVCGHYGCGGVHAALKNLKLGLIDSWLSPIHSTATSYASYLGGIADEAVQSERLCELNVIQQIVNAAETRVLRDAWDRGQKVSIHGWVYALKDGLVRYLEISISSIEDLARAKAANWTKLSGFARLENTDSRVQIEL